MIEGRSGRLGPRGSRLLHRTQKQREGLVLLAAIVLLLWLVEAINSLAGNSLTGDGIYSRNVSRFWGILTAPFIHASFQHLLDNTVPLVFLGVIVALKGAGRLLLITGFIVLVGGLGTWLIGPGGNASTIGASGVVFGYATYLLTRGFFDRSMLELGVGMIVGLIWGAVLISSLVPQGNVSWQSHLCGGIAGVIVAWRLSRSDQHREHPDGPRAAGAAGGGA